MSSVVRKPLLIGLGLALAALLAAFALGFALGAWAEPRGPLTIVAAVLALALIGGVYVAARRHLAGRQLAEALLRSSEEMSRLLLESSGEGIYGIDLRGDCTFANPACARLLGYDDPSQLLGRPTHELFHARKPDGSPYPREECPIYRTMRSGRGVQSDGEVFWRRDGSCFPVEYR